MFHLLLSFFQLFIHFLKIPFHHYHWIINLVLPVNSYRYYNLDPIRLKSSTETATRVYLSRTQYCENEDTRFQFSEGNSRRLSPTYVGKGNFVTSSRVINACPGRNGSNEMNIIASHFYTRRYSA